MPQHFIKKMHLPNFMARIWAGLITNNAWSVKKSRMVVDKTDANQAFFRPRWWNVRYKKEGIVIDLLPCLLPVVWSLFVCLRENKKEGCQVEWSEVKVKAKVLRRCKVREGRNNVLIFKSRKQQQQRQETSRRQI